MVFYVIGLGFFSADLTFENPFSFMISKFFVCFLHHRPYRVVKILENSREIRRIFIVVFFRLVYLLCIFLDLVHRWNGFRIVKLKFMTLEWVSSSEDIVTMITWKHYVVQMLRFYVVFQVMRCVFFSTYLALERYSKSAFCHYLRAFLHQRLHPFFKILPIWKGISWSNIVFRF